MSGIKIANGTAASAEQTVDTNGDAHVNLPSDKSRAGYAGLMAVIDEGTVLGSRYAKMIEASHDRRIRAGVDQLLFSEYFPGAAINSALWSSPIASSATVTVAGGFLTLNASLLTTSGAAARVTSYRSFSLPGTAGVSWRARIQFPQAPVSNNVCEWGLGIASGTTAPTDGAFFRYSAVGEFRCVLNFNGTESQSDALDATTLVGANTTREFRIDLVDHGAHFFVDDVMVADLDDGSGAVATAANGLPHLFRVYNSNVTSVAQAMKVSMVAVFQMDFTLLAPHAASAAAGSTAYQGQTGGTMGTTANYANGANPTAAVPTNTTAALGSGLGGQFWETDTLAVTTDGVICSFQNPAGTAALPGKTILVHGVKITSFVQTALTGGGYVAQYSLAFGHTAVSLATAEASGSATKAARRVALGAQTVASAATALTMLATVEARFDCPVPVNAGEFIAVAKKKVGTAPSAGVIAHVITFDAVYV